MSASESPPAPTEPSDVEQPLTRLPFPPLHKSHILHCSYHYWHPRYRSTTPKARLIPLTQPFLDYLRADGIVLPDEDEQPTWSDSDSGIFSSTDDAGDEEEEADPSAEWRDVHTAIKATMAELGGKVVPKLNWSAPKDATWISATNSMECRSPNDIYLLLKSSDFITHDLEHALDDCEEDDAVADEASDVSADIQRIPYTLVLRKFIQLNPSLEFRCFVRRRKLLALCQRDLNHFDFLFAMQDKLRARIEDFFDSKLRNSFPDEDFTFDVYVPPPHNRVWLIDVNPWAVRTDPLLFSWLELLTMPEPPDQPKEETVRIPIGRPGQTAASISAIAGNGSADTDLDGSSESESEEEEEADEELFIPEVRLVKRDDPEAYSFNTPQFSAHKLPKDVVDASQSGVGGLREFAENWKDILAKRQREEDRLDDSEED